MSYLSLMQDEIQLLSNKVMPQFQLLPMPKVDQSLLHVHVRIHEVPPLH